MSIFADLGNLIENVTMGARTAADKYDETDRVPDIVREFNAPRPQTYEQEFEGDLYPTTAHLSLACSTPVLRCVGWWSARECANSVKRLY